MSLDQQAVEAMTGVAVGVPAELSSRRGARSGGARTVSETGGRTLRLPQTFVATNPYIHAASKRVLDVGLAVVALFLLAPVMLILALLVKMSGPGPVIFKQKRNGIGGVQFNIYKFRTMHHVAEQSLGFVAQASRGDSRVTPVGYWLRRLSLDELPQLLNVLQGKMSLVGPRPHALSHDEYYGRHVRDYMRRYGCRPGITGLAQVSGSRGETAEHADMERRIGFDLEYIRTASLATDLRIIVTTALKLLDNKNVY